MKTWKLALTAAILIAGCKSKTKAETEAPAATDDAIEECEEYFTRVRVCIDNSSGKAKRAFELSRDQFRQQVDDASDAAAQKNAARNCQAALQALHRSPACKGDTATE